MRYVHLFVQEYLCAFLEFFGVFGSKIAAGALFGALFFDGFMAMQIIFKALCHIFALRNNAYAFAYILRYFWHK